MQMQSYDIQKTRFQMHTVELLLKPTEYECHEIDRRFHALAHVHNVCVKHARKLITQLEHDNEYQAWRKEYVSFLKMDTKLTKEQKSRKDQLKGLMSDRRYSMGLTEYGFMSYLKVCGRRYKKLLSSQQVQAEAKRVWSGALKYLFGDGKSIHFKKYKDFDTIGGKSNLNGAKFDKETMTVTWIGLKLRCFLPKNEKSREYVLKSLDHKISYCVIKRRMFSSGWRYYAVIVLDGDAPHKERVTGTSTMGIDPGVSTVAGVSDTCCELEELAPECIKYEKQIQKLLRHMDLSRRVSNPEKYRSDGTVIKGDSTPWVYSLRYKRMQRKLKTLYRKKREYTLQSHRELCNRLLEDSNSFIVEKMDFRALAKRKKATERQETASDIRTKDGTVRSVRKFKKKKRFGKSVNRRAPALFLVELKRKAQACGGSYEEVRTRSFKASQYNHVTDTYEKIPLKQRMKLIGERNVQRDLYSAFLIRNADIGLEHADREKCSYEFEHFADMNDTLISQMKADGRSMRQCFGF